MDQSFYDLSTADLQRAAIPKEVISRIITKYVQAAQAAAGGAVNVDYNDNLEVTALLAQLVKNNARAAVKYNIFPFSFVGGADVNNPASILQILPENPNRKFLAVQINNGSVVTNTTYYMLFEEASITPQILDSNTYVNYTTRAMNITPSSPAGADIREPYFFSPAPTNAISIIGFAEGVENAEGLIIEGV